MAIGNNEVPSIFLTQQDKGHFFGTFTVNGQEVKLTLFTKKADQTPMKSASGRTMVSLKIQGLDGVETQAKQGAAKAVPQTFAKKKTTTLEAAF